MEPTVKSSDHFLTNMRAEYEPLIKQAAKDTKFDIYVVNRAAWFSGYVQVHTREHRDHTPFWNRFDELRQEHAQQNQVV